MNKIRNFFLDWTLFEKTWLISASIIMIILSVMWQDGALALISGLAGIISVVLCAKGKILNYAFGMVQAVTYAYLTFQAHIYGEFMYNIYMIPMIIIGFISWKKNMNSEGIEVKARNLTVKAWILLGIITVCAIVGYCFLLIALGGEFTLIDSTSTVLSVIATILMVTRYSEQWLMWILVNIASVILWFMALQSGTSGGVTMLVMWAAYLLNSIYGWHNWRKMAKEEDSMNDAVV